MPVTLLCDFPQVQKIHKERTFKYVVSFDELQELARRRGKHASEDSEIEEERDWLEKLQGADPLSLTTLLIGR